MAYIADNFDGEIVRLLQNGGAGLLPSDTIYGLSCRALNCEAVEKVHRLKTRDADKPFIVLISDIKMLDLLSISAEQADLANLYWPGRLSIIFNAPKAPAWLQMDTGTLAVRLPDFPDLRGLIAKTGPLISTSANTRGGTPAGSVGKAKKYFGDKLDFYVDAGRLAEEASTLVEQVSGKLRIVRQGAVKINEKELA